MVSKQNRLSTTIPSQYVENLDVLVERGVYLNQAEAVRVALRLLFKHHNLDIIRGKAEG